MEQIRTMPNSDSTFHPDQIDEPILLCGTPRSGSWMLAWALAASLDAAQPIEAFNDSMASEVQHTAMERGLFEYTSGLRAEVPSGKRLLAKVHFDDLRKFILRSNGVQWMSHDDLLFKAASAIRTFGPTTKVVHLMRRDTLRQGVSLWRARLTGEWELYVDAAQSRTSFDPPIALALQDRQTVFAICDDLLGQDEFWRSVLCEMPHVFVMHYECLLSDWSRSILGLQKWLDLPDVAVVPFTVQQSDSWSDTVVEALREPWKQRYVARQHTRSARPLESHQ